MTFAKPRRQLLLLLVVAATGAAAGALALPQHAVQIAPAVPAQTLAGGAATAPSHDAGTVLFVRATSVRRPAAMLLAGSLRLGQTRAVRVSSIAAGDTVPLATVDTAVDDVVNRQRALEQASPFAAGGGVAVGDQLRPSSLAAHDRSSLPADAALAVAIVRYDARSKIAVVRGRTVVAAARMDAAGKLDSVHDVAAVAVGAVDARADVLLVPERDAATATRAVAAACDQHCPFVAGVQSLAQALHALRLNTPGGALAAGFTPDATTLGECAGMSDAPWIRCVAQAFGNVAFHQGPRPALMQLRAARARDAQLGRVNHSLEHTIGQATLLRHHGDVGAALGEDVTEFHPGGYYHGLLTARTDQAGTAAERATLRQACVRQPDHFARINCIHGLGHGLMVQTNNDLPAALAFCDGFAGGEDQHYCQVGVFMENLGEFLPLDPTPPSDWVRANAPLYPCTAVDTRYKRACYEVVDHHLGPYYGWNWARMARECGRAEAGYVQFCMDGVARRIVTSNAGDVAPIRAACASTGSLERACVLSVATVWAEHDAGDARRHTFCQTVAPGLRRVCASTALASYRATSGRTA